MNKWRWLGTLVVMTGLFSFLAAMPSQAQDKDSETWEWKAFSKKDNVFYQVVTTDTDQTMKVMGQEVNQKQNQTFYIEWKAGEPKDGMWNVTQKIIGIKMKINIGGNTVAYDSTDDKVPANPMTDFFKTLTSAELKLTIDPKTMKVTKIEGAEGPGGLIEKLGGQNQQLQPLLKSILSDAALKQMAEPAWGAFPNKAVKKGDTWDAKFQLDLGGIGTYDTEYKYTLEGVDKGVGTIKIDPKLTYKAPGDKRGLPFQIKAGDKTKLESVKGAETTGEAKFDKEKGRIDRSTVKMKLEGELEIVISDMTTVVGLVQTQNSTTTTSDTNPIAAPAPQKK